MKINFIIADIAVKYSCRNGRQNSLQPLHINIRNRFFEISRGSVIEIDSAIGIAHKLEYVKIDEIETLGNSIVKTFKVLSGMIKTDETHN